MHIKSLICGKVKETDLKQNNPILSIWYTICFTIQEKNTEIVSLETPLFYVNLIFSRNSQSVQVPVSIYIDKTS